MAEPQLVAHCMAAMREVVDIPVTVKTRIGIDDQDSYEFLTRFIAMVSEKGGALINLLSSTSKALAKWIKPQREP